MPIFISKPQTVTICTESQLSPLCEFQHDLLHLSSRYYIHFALILNLAYPVSFFFSSFTLESDITT